MASALGVGGTVAVVSTFNARFGDAAAAFAAILGSGVLLVLIATTLAFVATLPTLSLSLLAHPLPHGALLLALLAVIAKPAKPLGRGTGALILVVTVALLAAVVLFAASR